VLVGVAVGVWVAVFVGVLDGVFVAVLVGVLPGVGVSVVVAVPVAVAVGVGEAVAVAVAVRVAVSVAVGATVLVAVCVGLCVAVAVAVGGGGLGVFVAVGVGVLVAVGVRVAVPLGVGVTLLVGEGDGGSGVGVAVGTPPPPVTSTTVVPEMVRRRTPLKAAETRRPNCPSSGSLTLTSRVKTPSPASRSPFRPSSCMVPRVATNIPAASTRCKNTLAGISTWLAGSIGLVTISMVGWPTATADGSTRGAPTVGAPTRPTERADIAASATHVPRHPAMTKPNCRVLIPCSLPHWICSSDAVPHAILPRHYPAGVRPHR
jgi:hypothetical protein